MSTVSEARTLIACQLNGGMILAATLVGRLCVGERWCLLVFTEKG